jgi:excisionase family DNA binding protein
VTGWSGGTVAVSLAADALELIAARAAEIVLERAGVVAGSPWLTRDAAAAYLGLPVSRLEKDREIPCHRDGRRVLYHRDELDTFFLRGAKD